MYRTLFTTHCFHHTHSTITINQFSTTYQKLKNKKYLNSNSKSKDSNRERISAAKKRERERERERERGRPGNEDGKEDNYGDQVPEEAEEEDDPPPYRQQNAVFCIYCLDFIRLKRKIFFVFQIFRLGFVFLF